MLRIGQGVSNTFAFLFDGGGREGAHPRDAYIQEASQRRIMRFYGARFTYAPGETPDEEPAPEPVTA